MKILILDNAIDRDIYSPISHWKKFLTLPSDAFWASKGELPESIDEYTHVIITGSEATITEEADWVQREEILIRKAVADGLVILGSCYGHQLLAKALFGSDSVGKSETPELGWDYLNVIKDDSLFGDAGAMLPVLLIHFDEVRSVPEDHVDIIASTKNCRIHIFKLKGKPVWGIQAHPEIDIDEGRATIERMIKKAEDENSPRLKFFLKARGSTPKEAGWFETFMKKFQSVGDQLS